MQYRFKHALTRQAAYDALLTERRRLLHERTAEAIEVLYSERLEEHYADLADHYGLSNNTAKAVEYLRLAGEQAGDRGAYAQALANAEAALKVIERLPEGAERLRAELGVRLLEGTVAPVLYGLGSEERLRASERVCELSERLGDQAALFRGLMNEAFVHLGRGEISRAREIARRCVALAERNPNSEVPPPVQYLPASCANSSGDYLQACSLYGQMMMHLESAHQGDVVSFTPINLWAASPQFLAQVQQVLRRSDEALKLSNEALRRAGELKQLLTLSTIYGLAALLHHLRREPEAARELAEVAIAVAEENGFENWITRGRSVRGWVLAESGEAAKGIAELEANAPLLPRYLQAQAYAMLAHVYIRSGRADRALQLLDQVLDRDELTGLHRDDAELHRLKGEAILGRDSSTAAPAEECFRRAIEIARGQSAKWWELRATVSLGRLLRDTNRRQEAHAMLADIYNWFTEGFDTADLKEAKALLEELSNSPR